MNGIMAPTRRKIRISTIRARGFICKLLAEKYDLEYVEPDESPDLILFGGLYPHLPPAKHLAEWSGIKIFETGENHKPDFKLFDYAFSFEDTSDRNFLLPGFARFDLFDQLRTGRHGDKLRKYREFPKSEFCNFIYRNIHWGQLDPKWIKKLKRNFFGMRLPREKLCETLAAYKKVDCPSTVLRNMGQIKGKREDKLNFIKRYKFTIAGENVRVPHANYITEKIFDPLLVGSIPIYWGCPNVAEYFNPEAFINCHDYDNFDGVLKQVIEVDNDDELYQKYVNAPPLLEGSKLHGCVRENVAKRLDQIVAAIGSQPVSATFRPKWRVHFHKFPQRLRLYLLRNVQKRIFD